MDGNKTVTAVFVETPTLTTLAQGSGTVTPSSVTLDKGSTVQVSATASEGWQFDHWTGDAYGSENPITVTLSSNKTVTAVFIQPVTLAVAVQGTGTVTPASGIYARDTQLSLQATAGTGYRFDHWEGAATGNINPVLVAMNGDKTVTAVFVPIVQLVVTNQGQGTVSLNPPGCIYDVNTVVTLTAAAPTSWGFSHWEGDLTGNQNPASVTMDTAKAVTAVFTPTYTLTTEIRNGVYNAATGNIDTGVVGTGGSITRDPSGSSFISGQTAVLTATPIPNYVFVRWEGDVTGTQNPATITMDSNKTVRAVFMLGLGLGVFVEGEGQIIDTQTGEPATAGARAPGTSITVQAVPAEGWTFVRWRGAVESTEATRTLSLIDEPENLVAEFLKRTGAADLNLVQDLANMLTALGSTETVETFDRNHCAEIQEDNTWEYGPNGIPDAAEFSLLQTILKDFRLDLTRHSGVNSDLVWKAWEQNLAQAQLDLPGVTNMSILRTVAAYMTLGDYPSTHMITELIHGIEPTVTLNDENYDTNSSIFLAHDEDADNDGISNETNWNAIVALGTTDAFTTYGTAVISNTGIVPTGNISSKSGSTKASTKSSCQCESSLYKGSVQGIMLVLNGQDPAAIGSVTTSPTGDQPLGTKIDVTATANTPNGYAFSQWLAPGTMLNGSREAHDSFKLMNSSINYISPGLGRHEATIPADTSDITISIEPSDGAILTTKTDGTRVVYGPPYSTVTLTASCHKADYSFLCFTNPDPPLVPRENWSKKVTLPLTGEIRAVIVPTNTMPSTPIALVSISAEKGGNVIGSHTPPEYGGSFRGAIRIPQGRNVNIIASPNFGYEFLRWSDGLTSISRSISVSESKNFSAKFVTIPERQIKIDDNIKGGPFSTNDDPSCMGYVTVENPDPDSEDPPNRKKYYSNCEQIAVVAHPNKNYRFAQWAGKGIDIKGDPIEGNKNARIVINMNANRSLQAAFGKVGALIVKGGINPDPNLKPLDYETPISPEDKLRALDYEPKTLTTPSKEELLEYLRFAEVFIFSGHSGNTLMCYNYPNVVGCNQVASAMVHVKLAVFYGCGAGLDKNWKNALQAEHFIGWSSFGFRDQMASFDSIFWPMVELEKPTASSYNQAFALWKSIWENIVYAPPEPGGTPGYYSPPTSYGNTLFSTCN